MMDNKRSICERRRSADRWESIGFNPLLDVPPAGSTSLRIVKERTACGGTRNESICNIREELTGGNK